MENYHAGVCEGQEALPPGFRFHPTDEELITYYLLKKVIDLSFTSRAIAEVDLNKCEPWHLPGKAKMGVKEWYFFSLKDRKYPTGLRTNRATGSGYWKATGKDREIFSSKTCSLLGMKKTLVFYRGRAPKGEKSNWVIHEYRLEGKFAYHYLSRNSKCEWVISRVFQKSVPAGGRNRPPPQPLGSATEPDVSSPSSVTPYNDRESCSYDAGAAAREHVPCFSTPGFGYSTLLDLPAVPPIYDPSPTSNAPFSRQSDVSFSGNQGGFCIRSLQENHCQPPLFSPFTPPPHTAACGGGYQMSGIVSSGQWGPPPDGPIAGSLELDCLWGY